MMMAAHAQRRGKGIPDRLLTLAAVVGVLAMGCALAASLFGVSISLFRTGSMEPTIGTGSAAIGVEQSAADVRIGDVVMVDRPGELPITHRVVAVSGEGTTRDLTLQGDANEQPDPVVYTVSDVHRVVFVVPKVAPVLAWFSNPLVLGGLTLGATGLVLWAFWPRHGRPAPPAAVEAEPVPTRSSGVLVVLPLAAMMALAPAEAAVTETQVIRGSVLELTSITRPDLMDSLEPGTPVEWIVGVQAQAPEPGIVDIAFQATGTAVPFMQIAIDECAQPWVAGQCATGARQVSAPATGFGPREQLISSMSSDEQRWIRVAVQLAPDTPDSEQGHSAALTVRATGFGDSVAITPQLPGSLPLTGSAALIPVLLGALGALAVGAVIAARRREPRVSFG